MYFAHSRPSSSPGVSFLLSSVWIACHSSSISSPVSPAIERIGLMPSPAARSSARGATGGGEQLRPGDRRRGLGLDVHHCRVLLGHNLEAGLELALREDVEAAEH